MKAVRVFNNNAVSVILPDGEEGILLGSGVGFAKRPGDEIDSRHVEKTFYMRSEEQVQFLELLKNTRKEALEAAIKILDHALKRGIHTGSHLILSLTDHISFALDRAEQGIELPYLMETETKMLYPAEYEVGKWALRCIQQESGVLLPKYEAGYIALQLASGGTDRQKIFDTLQLVTQALQIISDAYGIRLEEDNYSVLRLITHLKFLGQRIFSGSTWASDDNRLYMIMKETYPRAYQTALLIDRFIQSAFQFSLNEQEITYLMVHIAKSCESEMKRR